MSLFPFDLSAVPIDVSTMNHMEVKEGTALYNLLVSYIPAHVVNEINSARPNILPSGSVKDQSSSLGVGRISLDLGIGFFPFHDHRDQVHYALHQTVGAPVGTDCGATIYTSLIILSERSMEDLAQFCTYLVEQSELQDDGVFSCYTWHCERNYWRSQTACKARPLDSVVLPRTTKDRFLGDLNNFLSPETSAFYSKHGIPYRRSYLFYGVPGTGKTSLIQAVAGRFKRSISFLQPTNPKMTDDSLREAMQKLPKDTIVVFEDIDSLFAADRSNKVSTSSLTFSGLLNALDGVGNSNGQIVILTTNLREQLDPALIRNGRVDMHVEFTHATDEQMASMWSSFYPSEACEADKFVRAVRGCIGGRPVAAAGLQHFFVRNMRHSAVEALANAHWVLEDLIEKEVDEKGGAGAGGLARGALASAGVEEEEEE